jgi:hypothetical protein
MLRSVVQPHTATLSSSSHARTHLPSSPRIFRDAGHVSGRLRCRPVSVYAPSRAVRAHPLLFALAIVGHGALSGCGGEITVDYGGDLARAAPSGSGTAGPGQPLSPGGPEVEPPAPTTRAARLTHEQWENTVRDLFRLGPDSSFAGLLRSDPVQNGFLFDNNALSLSVDDALFSGYQRASAQVAEFVTADAARLATLAATGATEVEPRGRAFIQEFGLRAHRRPLTPAEIDEYMALFRMGPSFYTDLGPFEAGARVVIEAMLQSPYFVYRVEQSSVPSGALLPLTSHEIASRLSYALWNTMPDDALFAAASANRLVDSVQAAAEVERMLADPRAETMVQRFHDQLFEVDHFAAIKPSAAFFPNVPADFGASLAIENQRFVREIVFGAQADYSTLLTSNETFVNADLARVYGVPGSFGTAFTKVSLDPAQRKGVFTQLGFLALNATSVNPDPIHRGVYIARRFACMQIAAPPAMVPPVPEAQGRTNRETVAAHTEAPGSLCATCHAGIINPLGFPFENYDAIGSYRITDNSHPVDASADPLIAGEKVHVNNALELAQALANSAAAHRCYAQHWLEYAYGRPQTTEDFGMIVKLGDSSLQSRTSIKRLIATLVTSQAFLNRSIRELP